MTSFLLEEEEGRLQLEIDRIVRTLKNNPIIYISLDKTANHAKKELDKKKIGTKNIFFIDSVKDGEIKEDCIHIPPTELEMLYYAIKQYMKEIKGKKVLVIDALSTLLIYNDENKVAGFLEEVIEYADENEVDVFAFTPKTKDEKDLLKKIYNFFDKVKK